MVFKSQNLFRKCKYCDKEKKVNLTGGRHRGYYTTCGSKECLNRQYEDNHVCIKKGKLKVKKHGICDVCDKEFERLCPSHKTYCIECVPDDSWRCRARRYRIGKPQWEKLLQDQNMTCALCDRNPEVIDHCHSTGKVRGLLCNKCNTLIKLLDMGNEIIEKCVNYVGGSYSIQID